MATSVNTFDFIPASERIMYTTAFDAITQLELWPFMMKFQEESFMFSLAPEIEQISDRILKLGYDGHSGASFGWTMRAMEYIGKNGIDEFQNEYHRQAQKANLQRLERQQRLYEREKEEAAAAATISRSTSGGGYYIDIK